MGGKKEQVQEISPLESTLVKLLTRGDAELDQDLLKSVKTEAKKGNEATISLILSIILTQLKRDHSQIRYSSVQLIDILFKRSAMFRTRFIADHLSLFFDLAIGLSVHDLPEPKPWNERLRATAISCFKQWYATFGSSFKALQSGYTFLQDSWRVSFENIHFTSTSTSTTTNPAVLHREQTVQDIRRRKYEASIEEMEIQEPVMIETMAQMSRCFEILIPRIESAGSSSNPRLSTNFATTSSYSLSQTVLSLGLGSRNYRLDINLKGKEKIQNIQETAENAIIFESLRDLLRQLQSHRKRVLVWMDNVNKAIVPDKFGQEVTLRRLIDIKLRMSDVEAKAVELGISSGPSNRIPNDEGRKEEMEDEDEDEEEYGEEFEEVIGGGGGGVGGGDDYSPATSESLSSSSTTNSTIHPTTTPDSAPAALNNTTTAGGPSSSRMVSSSSLSRSLYNNLDIVSTAVLPSSKEIFRYTLENQYRTDPTVINPSAANRVKTAIAGFKGKHCGGGGGGGEGEDVASTERGVDSERAALLAIAPIVEHDTDLDFWDKSELDISSGLEYNHRFWSAGGADSVKLGGAALEAMKKRTVFVEAEEIPNHITPCRAPGPGGRLCMRRDLYRCPMHGPIIARDESGKPLDPEAALKEQEAAVSAAGNRWQQIEKDVAAQVDGYEESRGRVRRKRRGGNNSGQLGGEDDGFGPNLIDVNQRRKESAKTRILKKIRR